MLVLNTENIPIKIWAEESDLVGFDDALTQAKNLANHPLSRQWVCLMSDFHVGYGMPIGGVLATQGGAVPYAVGVDIGCGMIAAQTDIPADSLSKDWLQKLREEIHRRVPVGHNHHKDRQHQPYLTEATTLPIAQDPVIGPQLEAADYQIGSLGGGNHFIEIQRDQDGRVWVMLHSGSRNLGKRVCDYYHGRAKTYMEMFHSQIPDMDLAFLPVGIPEHDAYLAAMRFCMGFAEASREAMYQQVEAAMRALGVAFTVTRKFDTHHNFAATEKHFGQNLMIHRKGAVKAEGLLTIPGSMGTASYICDGLSPRESFNSCSHGAGRVLGRKQANRTITHDQAVAAMKDVVFGVRTGDYDEMPMAYKDIDRIIAQQSDLVTPLYRLSPLAVVKG
jgi:tRNA-splicing ligase RtcB (3'-phosphate/5'-hydroxy nucleic acid ligase)